MKTISTLIITLLGILCFPLTALACTDPVVLVHGNTATPSSWNNTYNYLLNKGYSPSNIYRPNWGSKSCAACNNHSGSEETPVRQALINALANSCSGQIDVIGHSMGATLAAQQIEKLAIAANVDS
ncbi:MAG: esterase/lipase family protein, partial [Psychrobium sp.]